MADTQQQNCVKTGVCCIVCGKRQNLKRCGFCKRTYYCSREHQMVNWSEHKPVCSAVINTVEQMQSPVTANNTSTGHSTRTYGTLNHNSPKDTVQTASAHYPDSPENQSTPFDKRPLCMTDCLSLNPKTEMSEIAAVVTQHLNQYGFCVIDNCFTENQIKAAVDEILILYSEDKLKPGMLAGGRASDSSKEKVVNHTIRSDNIFWVEGTEDNINGITRVVQKMDTIFIQLNKFLQGKNIINGRTKAMVACYPGNKTYYQRHVDNPNKDGRLVTCILYLNEGWNVEEDGGILRIFPEGRDKYVDVAPVANRLLFFWSDRRNPHEVHPAFRHRYAITVWYMDKAEREQAKLDMTDTEMAHVRGEYALQEVQQKQKEVDEVHTKLEENASNAISALSVEELQALAKMIEDVPDPHAVLSELGIQSNIQDKLLAKLRDLSTE